MADKIFTDNDLLQEKSYDTRIAEAANVEADTDYLEQVPFKKRLTEAVESGGGSIDIEFRTVTITNNHSENSSVRLSCAGKLANGSVRYTDLAFTVDNGKTKSFEIVSTTTMMSKYTAQQILVEADFQPTATSAELGDLAVTDLGIAATTKYNLYFIKIPVTTYKDFSITFS